MVRHNLSHGILTLSPAMRGACLNGEGQSGRTSIRETIMRDQGYATYNAANNTLEVIRPGENTTRIIRCAQIYPNHERVHGVMVDGDDILVLVGPRTNPRPTHARVYSFMSLSGGRREPL
jgi:hypothetical protein